MLVKNSRGGKKKEQQREGWNLPAPPYPVPTLATPADGKSHPNFLAGKEEEKDREGKRGRGGRNAQSLEVARKRRAREERESKVGNVKEKTRRGRWKWEEDF